MKDIPFRAFYFLGDAYYSMESELLKEIKQMGMVAVVPVRESLRVKVRSQERLWAKEKYEMHKELYKRVRYKIEQLIGNVKNLMDDRDNTRIYDLASLYVLARFAVYNFLVLWKLYLFFELLRAVLRNQAMSMFWDFSNSLKNS
ncbi:transposase [Hydrogenobacter hydrogenophilus]|uniref:transposase n=1 Tax=Hydrogenobacter hydrogenophilus TaxID=35835 RepID=UPI0015DE476D|nr:transposase [Hydrogenobacter hydrogenophilus]